MSDKVIRQYYEKLAQERYKLHQKVAAEGKHFWSADYHYWGLKERLIALVLEVLSADKTSKVLDVGCGLGGDLLPLLKENLKGFGMDLSITQVKRASTNEHLKQLDELHAKKQKARVKLLEVDGRKLTFVVEAFDELEKVGEL